MRLLELGYEVISVDCRCGTVLIIPEKSGARVRVIANPSSTVEPEPPYPLVGYGLAIRHRGDE